MERTATSFKLQDTSPIIGENSRLERYWSNNGFSKFYTQFRTGIKMPSRYHTVDKVDKLIKLFNLNAIGFGNWVTQEDRFNYMSALTIALYDIDKVVKFKSNIGLNKMVSFSFGARGNGGALAHFEPHTFIINITRYQNSGGSKSVRFLHTGGAGSVAHEWGHAIDYYFGLFRESSSSFGALSGGNTTRTNMPEQTTTLRKKMGAILSKLIWRSPGIHSDYYNRLSKHYGGDYMFRRNELFARTFERYIQIKLSEIGINNNFLNDTKYSENAYLTSREMAAIKPLMDDLISSMARQL